MKLNSFLVKSRYGIFYLRLQRGGVDRRISLRTRDPERAMYMAYQFGVKVHTIKNISTYELNDLQQSWRFIAGVPQRRW